ncbi:MAG: glycosyltransferase family 9 protein [Lentisphaerae bacterium]|nr:glycosyltransferase family 9 protein [Lentisphaerota bacterium]
MPARSGSSQATVVYTPGHLGDVLHVVPMLKALKQAKPNTKIIWLVGPWSESLARRYAGYVDEIAVFGPNLPPFTRGRREWRQSAWRQWRMAMSLRREEADVLIGPLDGVGRFLANAISPRLWIGIGDRRPPRVRQKIETSVQPYEKDRYEADAWCGLLKPLGLEAHAERLEYVVTPAERAAAAAFLGAEGVAADRPLALIAPGSGWIGKNWLPDRFGEVAEWLSGSALGDYGELDAAQGEPDRAAFEQPGSAGMPRPTESLRVGSWAGRTLRVSRTNGFQIAWVGGSGEESLVPASRAVDFNWVGKTPLPLLAAVMERANLFLGNDSGLLHLAAALDVPTVSIWGPTSPGKWGPKGSSHCQIRKVERCEGCIYWDYRETCLHEHACMKAVEVEEVQRAIWDVMKFP